METPPSPEPQESALDAFEPAFGEALTRLARYDRRNASMLRRMRVLYGVALLAMVLAIVLSAAVLTFAVHKNADRITDIQRARVASITYACQQQNAAHLHTLVFLDKTELNQLHARVGPQRYPAIERHTVAVLQRQPKARRAMLLSNHKLLLAFINNLAPHQRCAALARKLSAPPAPTPGKAR